MFRHFFLCESVGETEVAYADAHQALHTGVRRSHGCEVLLFECSQNISVPSRPLNSYEAYFNFIISRRIFRSSNLSNKESMGWTFSEVPFIRQNNLILFNSAHPAAAGARTGAPSATGSTQFRRGARAGAGMVRVFAEIRRKSTEFDVKCVEFREFSSINAAKRPGNLGASSNSRAFQTYFRMHHIRSIAHCRASVNP